MLVFPSKRFLNILFCQAHQHARNDLCYFSRKVLNHISLVSSLLHVTTPCLGTLHLHLYLQLTFIPCHLHLHLTSYLNTLSHLTLSHLGTILSVLPHHTFISPVTSHDFITGLTSHHFHLTFNPHHHLTYISPYHNSPHQNSPSPYLLTIFSPSIHSISSYLASTTYHLTFRVSHLQPTPSPHLISSHLHHTSLQIILSQHSSTIA